jgi:hypothetical protein
MRTFKTKPFVKNAKAERLTDQILRDAIIEVRQGLIDAYLGGNLVKKRIAIGGKGKSGGIRTILVYTGPAMNVFCVHIFAKNEVQNITAEHLMHLKRLAQFLLSKNEKEIEASLEIGELFEVE